MSSHKWLNDIAVIEGDDIVFEKYPELQDREDHDGLIPVSDTATNCQDGFSYKNHYLIYDTPLTSHNSLAQQCFQSEFQKLDLRFLIDYDRLGIPSKRRCVEELERWSGVKNIDRIKETDNISETSVHGGRSYCNGQLMDKTDFVFHKQDGDWHFKVEELLPMDGIEPDFSVSYRGDTHKFWTRYLHARSNESLNECYHIDGAIRVYGDEANFIERHKDDLEPGNKFKSETKRLKMFRIDSDSQPLDSFYELIGLFFKQNPYVKEFFEGESDDSAELKKLRSNLLESSLGA